MESNQQNTNEDKTVAILSYIGLIGWVIAIIMHGSNKTELGKYHLRDGLGLNLTFIAVFILSIPFAFIPVLGVLIVTTLYIGGFVFWLLGLINAINGVAKPLPVLGDIYQNIFSSLGN